jgi:hypothetical protein
MLDGLTPADASGETVTRAPRPPPSQCHDRTRRVGNWPRHRSWRRRTGPRAPAPDEGLATNAIVDGTRPAFIAARAT